MMVNLEMWLRRRVLNRWYRATFRGFQTASFEVSRNKYTYLLILDTNHLTTLVEVQSWYYVFFTTFFDPHSSGVLNKSSWMTSPHKRFYKLILRVSIWKAMLPSVFSALFPAGWSDGRLQHEDLNARMRNFMQEMEQQVGFMWVGRWLATL